MKPWCSINQDQTEEESIEEDEDAASEADAAQGGRVWGGDTVYEQVKLPCASIVVDSGRGAST